MKQVNNTLNQGLISTTELIINKESLQTVNARELHAFLQIGKDFSTWIKDRISQYGFLENQDFIQLPKTGESYWTDPDGERQTYSKTLVTVKGIEKFAAKLGVIPNNQALEVA
jgi:phage anti-repressor protein